MCAAHCPTASDCGTLVHWRVSQGCHRRLLRSQPPHATCTFVAVGRWSASPCDQHEVQCRIFDNIWAAVQPLAFQRPLNTTPVPSLTAHLCAVVVVPAVAGGGGWPVRPQHDPGRDPWGDGPVGNCPRQAGEQQHPSAPSTYAPLTIPVQIQKAFPQIKSLFCWISCFAAPSFASLGNPQEAVRIIGTSPPCSVCAHQADRWQFPGCIAPAVHHCPLGLVCAWLLGLFLVVRHS